MGHTGRPIEDLCQYLEMIIPSQNTQVSSFRDLFKGCNKAPGPLAKRLSAHSTQGFNNAAVHIESVRDQTALLKGKQTLQPDLH